MRVPTQVGREVLAPARMAPATSANRSNASVKTDVKLNNALLAKYGISIHDGTEGSVLLAKDNEEKSLSLLVSQDSSHIPLNVSASQYEKFKQYDLETLREIYDSKVKSIVGNVVRISVKAPGDFETLEFYAIKEGGKVIFQPIRKNKLSDLRLNLPKNN